MEPGSLDDGRTVVVSGVPDVLPGCRMTDKLTVHFQSRRRSHGGDVEVVAYPTDIEGVAYVTFDRAEDAERVVRKEEQVMTDGTFRQEYVLTVFPFTTDVFFYVTSAEVDLSVFDGDHASLIQRLRSAHRSLRFQPLSHDSKATVEGPFSAVRALREDLAHRASQLKSTVPAATVKLRESPPNPRVISHHECVGPVSCGGSKAKREAAGSSGLSALLQSTGEATEVQSRLSNAKTPNSARQKVQSFCDADSDEVGKLKAPSRLKLTTEYTTERAKASSLSSRHLHPTGKVSAKQPAVDDGSQKHTRTDRVSNKTRTHLDSNYSRTDYLKESASSVPAKTSVKHVSVSSEKTEDLSAGGLRDPEDTCIWVDSCIFKYIKKFDTEYYTCLRGLNTYVEEAEGSDFVRICLTEKQPSRGTLRIQQALDNLKALVKRWQSTLRVHEIRCDEVEHPKQRLTQMCNNVKIADILYVVEDSRIKVVGPSSSSYLAYRELQFKLKYSADSK